MAISINFQKLGSAIEKMGAKLEYYDLKVRRPDPLSELVLNLETHGVEINLEDVDVNSGGLLSYKGLQVVLYIKDHRHFISQSLKGKSGYRFHVSECQKIEEMRNEGRFERYVVSRNVSGQFIVVGNHYGNDIEGITKLDVCRYCLRKLNYNNYRNKIKNEKNGIVENFDISRFFSKYSSFFKGLPSKTDNDKIESYGDNWKEISSKYRQKVGWVCDQCGVNLTQLGARRLLHTHHINGVTSDHRESNLKALCKDCHSKQAMHGRIFVTREDRQLINKLRNEQSSLKKKVKSGQTASEWDEVFELADPATFGLLDMCKHDGWETPTPGYEIYIDNQVQCPPLELAWEKRKIAVVIDKADLQGCMTTMKNWKIYTLSEAMNKWFGI